MISSRIMTTEALTLNHLVDLALGTPDVGAVNFNVLHTLLHAVINKLDIGAVKAEISEADKNYLALNRDGSLLSAPSRASTVGKDSGLDTDGESGREDTGIIPHRHSHHHILEKKVAQIEDKLKTLDKLPSNEDLFSRTRGEAKKNAVSEMWQNIQLAKRVDANEGGISKVSVLVFGPKSRRWSDLKGFEFSENSKARGAEFCLPFLIFFQRNSRIL